MNRVKNMIAPFGIVIFLSLLCQSVFASDVQVRLSTREAYVGSPVGLQISVVNGENVKAPQLPEVDGLEVDSAGPPSQSTQITIINGRHSETKTATYSFLLTPQREGSFRIPAFEVDAGDRAHQVDAISFVATKSETGDLLFVEVEGEKETAYVGESVDLSLKIWLKPFSDRQRRVKLTEGDMWNCIADNTSWGPFADRMAELAARGQRPGGEEVLRKDDDGVERSYYLYQIDAAIYPKRAGKLDMQDVRVVVNYPTELGVSRGAFGSRLQRSGGFDLFDDDFFDAFSDRLVISERRPIVGQAVVGNTEILPIPTEGQPADYQGAVGQYDIAVKAANTNVAVGEPISLQIDIQGTGPMDLVQPPRLEQVEALKSGFRVSTQTLAGTTMGPVKYFDTTIRPIDENVTQIPPIPFSFFDPAEKKFKTVYSRPIPIQVRAGETLALDSIVAEKQPEVNQAPQDRSVMIDPLKNWNWDSWKTTPDFSNSVSSQMLLSEPRLDPSPFSSWLWIPPLVWMLSWILRWRNAPALVWNAARSNDKKFTMALAESAKMDSPGHGVAQALSRFIVDVCQAKMPNAVPANPSSTTTQAIGSLRLLGLYRLAADVETFFNRCQDRMTKVDPQQLRAEAIRLADEVKDGLKSCRPKKVATRNSVAQLARQSGLLWVVFVATSTAISQNAALAVASFAGLAEDNSSAIVQQANQSQSVELEDVLKEATQLYSSALQDEQAGDPMDDSDSSVDAGQQNVNNKLQQRFERAAEKYQYVIDSGVQNHQLFLNAGNAYAKAGKVGHAIFNYEKGLQLRPGDSSLLANLQSVEQAVKSPEIKSSPSDWSQLLAVLPTLWWSRLMLASWVGFWGLLVARHWGLAINWIWVGFLFLLSIASGFVFLSRPASLTAIVVTEEVTPRESDGDSFPPVAEFKDTDGWRLPVLDQRGEWIEVELSAQRTGWLPQSDVLLLN